MKTLLLTCSLAVVLGTGCATTSSSLTDEKSVLDRDRIAKVNQAADRQGVQVIWVNPPRKRVRRENDS